ncbi:MAG: peptidyl-alpha-hydroxyglycine alpha-amidating lyase family protein [Longimicrobiales bacterium]
MQTHRVGSTLVAAVALLAASAAAAQEQARVQPTNDAANPYQTIEGWAKMPAGRTWGSTSAVDIDKDGVSIWVAERCGVNDCLTSNLPSVLKFDANGNLVKAFGAGMIISPHGIHVDRDGNVWVTDCTCTGAGGGRGRGAAADSAGRAGAPSQPQPPPKGHQVFKFSPDGQLLLTLGKVGGGREPDHFWQPNDVLVAPNGDIFVAEGHSSAATANARILKFSRAGTFIKAFGTKGTGPGQLDQPHALAMDSRGRLFVGDRSNNRIVIYDQEGAVLDTWYQFSRPSGIYIDANDIIYVADSESGSVGNARETRKDWKRGIRVGSARDGSITAFIPDPNENATNTSAAEGVAADSRGNIYGAEVGPRALKKYVRR